VEDYLNVNAGDKITQFFVIRSIEYRTGKSSGSGYIAVEFGHRNGRIAGNIWNDAERIVKEYAPGDIVKVRGTVDVYKDKKRISVEKIRKNRESDGINPADFIPAYEGDAEELKNDLKELITFVNNPFLKKLLELFFSDKEFLGKFCSAPGGKLWHHAYSGGLMEHSVSVAKMCKMVAGSYANVDTDLLLTGALLHDIGKVREYSLLPFIDYTDEGRLLGHVVIGAGMVEDKIKMIKDFPEGLKKRVLHMILSHQGALENASPVVPMTLEAIILHHTENLDSKANAFMRIIKRENEPGIKWSKYVHLIDRFIYFGEEEGE